jgi:predicted dienelactone hydrolase
MLQKLQSEGTATAALNTLQSGVDAWGKPDVPRVKAAFVMAPLSVVFDQAGLSHVDRPVFLYYGQEDQVLIPQENALHIVPMLKALADVKVIPRAGHYVFLAPCSPQLARDAPDICTDPPGVDRVAVHRRINADALAFFTKQFAK